MKITLTFEDQPTGHLDVQMNAEGWPGELDLSPAAEMVRSVFAFLALARDPGYAEYVNRLQPPEPDEESA